MEPSNSSSAMSNATWFIDPTAVLGDIGNDSTEAMPGAAGGASGHQKKANVGEDLAEADEVLGGQLEAVLSASRQVGHQVARAVGTDLGHLERNKKCVVCLLITCTSNSKYGTVRYPLIMRRDGHGDKETNQQK